MSQAIWLFAPASDMAQGLSPQIVQPYVRGLFRVADGALAVALERFGELGVNREVLGH